MQSEKIVRKKWRNFDVGEQPITIKLCVFVMEMANKHDGNDINNNVKAISLSVTSLQVAELIFRCSIDHLTKDDKRRWKGIVLHSQRMKMVSYVQPVIREPEDSWHKSAFDSWIHIIGKFIKHSQC